MSLIEQIQQDITAAMKARGAAPLHAAHGQDALKNREIEKMGAAR